MKKLQGDCVSWLVLFTGVVQLLLVCGEGVYLSLGSTNITTNNTEILITDIGDDVGDGRPSLICHTDLVACCTPSETMAKGIGLWRYPNGTRVPGESGASRPYVSLRNGQSIKLARRESLLFSPPLSPTGSYCCTIPTNEGVMMFCANLVVCLSLPALNNGIVSYSHLTLGLNTVAIYTCDTGYTLNGGTTRTCGSDGVWSGSDLSCLPCSDLTLTNGDIVYTDGSPDNRPIGSRATYSCNLGYTITRGSTTRTCVSGGRWDGSPSTCQNTRPTVAPPTTCSDLTNPTRGMTAYNMGTASPRPVDTVATYTCATGYTLNGVTTRTCGSDGVWSGSSPVCQRIGFDLPSLTNGMISYNGGSTNNRPVGTVAIFSCNTGYTLNEDATKTCGNDGMWSGSSPVSAFTYPY
ncbi:sushi, von Willebrand factor type A, EGF and pentraxin domain-containing protein 1-like [Halichondria panicea]|uniref:sushi, von Willebrand factor type A, EGF and pentraxin domain-containing protein 1-like n=1 Tax=Halichondria panicea TaxID=6063 RepID=UPI00312BB7DC